MTTAGGEYLTQKALTVFLAHVRETDNTAVARRPRNPILITGGQRVDLSHLADRRRTGY